ncbi:MAG TPA: metallopeptidase family protein [Acidobacteriota bacterium]|nr:metallopeptidase family protein [Acidobacteriota bacterium]
MKRKEFESLVEKCLGRIPRVFREALDNVQIFVEDWPKPDLMEELLGDRATVPYGLFVGKPITEKHFDDWGEPPAMIWIWQKPLEEDFPDEKELEREVEVTLAHEIAHYMGFDESTLEKYGYG